MTPTVMLKLAQQRGCGGQQSTCIKWVSDSAADAPDAIDVVSTVLAVLAVLTVLANVTNRPNTRGRWRPHPPIGISLAFYTHHTSILSASDQ